MSSFIEVGAGNYVNSLRLIAVVGAESAPVRRMMQDARDRGALVDATSGRKTLSALIMDSDHVVCSALEPEAISRRLAEVRGAAEADERRG